MTPYDTLEDGFAKLVEHDRKNLEEGVSFSYVVNKLGIDSNDDEGLERIEELLLQGVCGFKVTLDFDGVILWLPKE